MPPVEGWDPVDQTRVLASCVVEAHGLIGTPLIGHDFFDTVTDSCLHKPPKPWSEHDVICVSLEQFIQEGDWERSGLAVWDVLNGHTMMKINRQ